MKKISKIYGFLQVFIPIVLLNEKAIKGQKLWQKYNCSACHQIYGLGGYLGPDLTNIVSNPNKGPDYVKAFLNSGVKVMPKFNFTKEEKDEIVEYLKFVDSSGFFPNKNYDINILGWVKIKMKNNSNDK